jgi:XTP/dITP diphosphohydrolase
MVHAVLATRNRRKCQELAALLPRVGIRWHALSEFPQVPAVRELGRSFEANAIRKAKAVARATGCLTVADDSGLQVDALGGSPGVRSARFAGRHGDDAKNNTRLLRLLEGLSPSRRQARYWCALALASPTRLIAVVHGSWEGRIALKPAGGHGFGYDPIFLVPRFGKTVGQLPRRIKQQLSHRAQAARKLKPVLRRLLADMRWEGVASIPPPMRRSSEGTPAGLSRDQQASGSRV